jgi:hypothetical protein
VCQAPCISVVTVLLLNVGAVSCTSLRLKATDLLAETVALGISASRDAGYIDCAVQHSVSQQESASSSYTRYHSTSKPAVVTHSLVVRLLSRPAPYVWLTYVPSCALLFQPYTRRTGSKPSSAAHPGADTQCSCKPSCSQSLSTGGRAQLHTAQCTSSADITMSSQHPGSSSLAEQLEASSHTSTRLWLQHSWQCWPPRWALQPIGGWCWCHQSA